MPDAEDHFGPIDCFVVTFPAGEPTPQGFDSLTRLVDAGHIRILDVEFVKNTRGSIAIVDAADLGAVAAPFAGASSGLVDDADLTLLAGELADGALASVVVYEELSVLGVFDAFEAEGAQIVLEGHLSPQELADVVDVAEAS